VSAPAIYNQVIALTCSNKPEGYAKKATHHGMSFPKSLSGS
jgi:hypothetical protein